MQLHKATTVDNNDNADDFVTLQDSEEFMVQGGSNMFFGQINGGGTNEASTIKAEETGDEHQLRVNTHSTTSDEQVAIEASSEQNSLGADKGPIIIPLTVLPLDESSHFINNEPVGEQNAGTSTV